MGQAPPPKQSPAAKTGTPQQLGPGRDEIRGTKQPKQENMTAERGTHLQSVVRIQEQVPTADAAVDTAQGHEEAEGEEVPMIKVSHAVIQPGWGARI